MEQRQLKGVFEDFRSKLPDQEKNRSTKATWLLVTCIDCRYPHVVHRYMHANHEGELYDQLVLAGASLAAVDPDGKHCHWTKTFLEHVRLSIDLHEIDGVLVLNHRTCGAFTTFKLLTKEQENTTVETEVHRGVAEKAAVEILEVFAAAKRPGLCQVWLVPEVTDPAADDFPCVPEKLVERTG